MKNKKKYKQSRKNGPKNTTGKSGGGKSGIGPGRVVLYGTHAVKAALKNPKRKISTFYCTENSRNFLEEESLHLPAHAETKILDKHGFDSLLGMDTVHQSIAVQAAILTQPTLADVSANAKLLVMLDHVTDPHNVGAIMRSCAAFGAAAVIVQDRHSPPETGTLAKTACGALETIPMVSVTNLSRALDELKRNDFFVYGLDERGIPLDKTFEAADKSVLVMGAEGPGIRRLVAERCDGMLSLPSCPEMPSINVSNAAAVSLYAFIP